MFKAHPRFHSCVPAAALFVAAMLWAAPLGCSPGAGDSGNGTGNSASKCATTEECSDQQLCRDGACAPLPELSLELGVTDVKTEEYIAIEDGMDMPFYAGFQGLSEMYVTLRVAGLSALPEEATTFEVQQLVRIVSGEVVLHEFTQGMVAFERRDDDVAEVRERRLILDFAASSIQGREAEVSIVVSMEVEGRTVSASVVRHVTLALAG